MPPQSGFSCSCTSGDGDFDLREGVIRAQRRRIERRKEKPWRLLRRLRFAARKWTIRCLWGNPRGGLSIRVQSRWLSWRLKGTEKRLKSTSDEYRFEHARVDELELSILNEKSWVWWKVPAQCLNRTYVIYLLRYLILLQTQPDQWILKVWRKKCTLWFLSASYVEAFYVERDDQWSIPVFFDDRWKIWQIGTTTITTLTGNVIIMSAKTIHQ